MASQENALEKLRDYAKGVTSNGEDEDVPEGREMEDYVSRLSKSLQSLQNQVKQHEAALEQADGEYVTKLRANIAAPSFEEPSEDPRTRLHQVRTITAAYKSLTQTEPTLPLPESPLPALLAVRSTLNLIDQSKETIRQTKERLIKAQADLHREEQSLKDAHYLSSALEDRIQRLRLEQEEQSKKSTDDIAKGLMQEQERRRTNYAKEIRGLVKAFNRFVKEHLATMLAAEELGGPVVGDALDLDEELLKAGFTQQGKAKRTTTDDSKGDARRRRRNEEIWGGEAGNDSSWKPRGEKEAAAADFRTLTESLLNAAAGDGNSDPYINIPRESAAVRFLVRAKVAMFHPKDARKLRLLDFGAELSK
ncbi:MAG: hypothetical protein Q9217_000463 [Psora testacea]